MNHYRFVREGEDVLNKDGTRVVNYKEINIIAESIDGAISKINNPEYICVDSFELNKDWT